MNKGALIIISGPSGSGKDTVLAELFKRMPELKFSISSVSRAMREGEVEGQKYNFVTREYFEQMINDDKLLEYNVYCGNYYGTPKEPVEKCISEGREIVLEVDVNGAANVRKNCDNCYSIFILPPSFSELERRLMGRGTEAREVVEKRLLAAKSEMKRATEYDYVVINDDISDAVTKIENIIKAERCKLSRNSDLDLIN